MNRRRESPPTERTHAVMCHDTDTLARLVSSRLKCLEQLQQLGLRQRELIRGGEMNGLMKALAAKQRLITGLKFLDTQLDPFRAQSPDERNWRSPEARTRCAAEARRCESLLEQIMRQEQECEMELVHRRDTASTQLQGTHVAAQVHGAYVAHAKPASRPPDPNTEVPSP